jgi:hypothetical protein
VQAAHLKKDPVRLAKIMATLQIKVSARDSQQGDNKVRQRVYVVCSCVLMTTI